MDVEVQWENGFEMCDGEKIPYSPRMSDCWVIQDAGNRQVVRETALNTVTRVRAEGREAEYRRELAEVKATGITANEARAELVRRYQPLNGMIAIAVDMAKAQAHGWVGRRAREEERKKAKLAAQGSKATKSDRAAEIAAINQDNAEFDKAVINSPEDVDALEAVSEDPDGSKVGKAFRRRRGGIGSEKLSHDQMVDWVGTHLELPAKALLNTPCPNRTTWAMLIWARGQKDKFWAMFARSAEQRKKDEAGKVEGGKTEREMELEQVLEVVYEAARKSVVDAAELDRDNMGLPDLARAERVVLAAASGDDDE